MREHNQLGACRSARKFRGWGRIEAQLSPILFVPFVSPFPPLSALRSMSPYIQSGVWGAWPGKEQSADIELGEF